MMERSEVKKKYLWLANLGLFQVFDNKGNGSCLFRSISQALTSSECSSIPKESLHMKIRLEIVDHLKKHWDRFGTKLVGYWRWRVKMRPLESRCGFCRRNRKWMSGAVVKEKYLKRMRKSKEDGTFYELAGGSELYGFHAQYLEEVGDGTFEFFNPYPYPLSSHKPRYFFLFQRNKFTGHWQFIKPLITKHKDRPFPLHGKIRGKFHEIGLESGNLRENDEDILKRLERLHALSTFGDEITYESDTDWPPHKTHDDLVYSSTDSIRENQLVYKSRKISHWFNRIKVFKINNNKIHPKSYT